MAGLRKSKASVQSRSRHALQIVVFSISIIVLFQFKLFKFNAEIYLEQLNSNGIILAKARGAIDVVSLTIRGDFHVLFNNSAVDSWIRHISNIRTITFIGPPEDEGLFRQNMAIYYPHLLLLGKGHASSSVDKGGMPPPVRWANQSYWTDKYMKGYSDPCPYWKACQQFIKLHVFELGSDLGIDLCDDVLIVDSDTVWSRDVSFVNKTDGRGTYFEVGGNSGARQIVEAITAGPPPPNATEEETARHVAGSTLTPYRGHEGPNATGRALSHIVHHMLFRRNVMMGLHRAVEDSWNATSLWRGAMACWKHKHCQGRMAEYELYYAYAKQNYPQTVRTEGLTQGRDVMLGSAVCEGGEMECCREKGVLLKGCHDHRIKARRLNPAALGDMCCPYNPAS